MLNVEPSFVLYALLLEPGGCLRARITLFELVEPGQKKNNLGRQVFCLQLSILGSYGLFGWVHLGMVHRCVTTDSCHGADAVRARCTNSHRNAELS